MNRIKFDRYSVFLCVMALCCIVFLFSLAGCNTISGFGQDLQRLSEGVKQGFTEN